MCVRAVHQDQTRPDWTWRIRRRRRSLSLGTMVRPVSRQLPSHHLLLLAILVSERKRKWGKPLVNHLWRTYCPLFYHRLNWRTNSLAIRSTAAGTSTLMAGTKTLLFLCVLIQFNIDPMALMREAVFIMKEARFSGPNGLPVWLACLHYWTVIIWLTAIHIRVHSQIHLRALSSTCLEVF